MSFVSASFLLGLIAVGGPTLIHLINRRRHRTIQWAAMNFLREAVQRNRRYLELRDLLLLILRTLAVLLFVLAMARPFWSGNATTIYRDQPLHAVLVIDNSLSMGYTLLDRSLLDYAKEKSRRFIESLPDGSAVSIVPMAGLANEFKDAYLTREDAIEAIEQISLADRSAVASEAAERALTALRTIDELPTKRVAFLSDMQRSTWQGDDLAKLMNDLGDVQLIQLAPEIRENTWVDQFELRDGVADTDSPAVFIANIRHEGEEPRSNVRATFKVDGVAVDERFIDVLPGQNLRLRFEHRFDVAGSSTEPLFVPVELSLTSDHLAEDDHRMLVVPVLARVPVVFIDQYSDEEETRLNREGETWPLRRWLAPQTRMDDESRYLVEIRHRTIDTLTREDLREARVAVIAGIRSPSGEVVRLLREYVEQGGLLLIGAGAEFDPIAWQSIAWQDGEGILPMPLAAEMIGRLPLPEERETEAFRLDVRTLSDEVFYLDLPEAERERLYRSPFFFKAVRIDESMVEQFETMERERLEARRDWLENYERNEAEWAMLEQRGQLIEEQEAEREAARRRRASMFPDWLGWENPLQRRDDGLTIDQLVSRSRPFVMGRYDNGAVFMARREIGSGRVVMVSSGIFPRWNSLAVQPSVLIFDQLMRGMLTRSLPSRTIGPDNELILPLAPEYLGSTFSLIRPDSDVPISLAAEALGEDIYGLILRDLNTRGIYEIRIDDPNPTALNGETSRSNNERINNAGQPRWSMTLAINGPGSGSELIAESRERLNEKLADAPVRWIAVDEEISLTGAGYRGHHLWKWLMFAALSCVIAEMAYLTGSRLRLGGGR